MTSSSKYMIANKYAGALLSLSEQDKVSDSVKKDLYSVQHLFKENLELFNLMIHPVIPKQEKTGLLKDLLGSHITSLTLHFIMVLVEKGRLTLFNEIIEEFTELMNKKHNIVVATIITPLQMNQEQLTKLKRKLKSFLNKEVELIETIQEDIIAGAILKIDDKIIDNSLLGKYEKLKNQLC